MEDVLKIASYISQRYEYHFGVRIEEIKLHILLYFAQRECMVQTGHPLFAENFSASDGAVSVPAVHAAYVADALHTKLSDEVLQEYIPIFDHIFKSYAAKDMIGLTTLIQSEYSWKRANEEDTPVKLVHIGDISKDAERIRNRRFLLKHLQDFRNPIYV